MNNAKETILCPVCCDAVFDPSNKPYAEENPAHSMTNMALHWSVCEGIKGIARNLVLTTEETERMKR